MTFKELKLFCDEKIKKYPELIHKYEKELMYAKRFYKNQINLFKLLEENKEKIKRKYVIPFLLDFTDAVEDGEFEYKFVKTGSSGGINLCHSQ
jgi:hypothetical protein